MDTQKPEKQWLYFTALGIAQELLKELSPHCERIEIAGSIRREKPQVKDIEIVCIPKTENTPGLLFDTEVQRNSEFVKILNRFEKIKGDVSIGKYYQCLHPKGIKIDIFMVTKDNWGYQLAIRTGSANFSHEILGGHWKKAGYHSEDGYIRKGDTIIPVREEFEFFKMIRLGWIHPRDRYTEKEKKEAEEKKRDFQERQAAAKKRFYNL